MTACLAPGAAAAAAAIWLKAKAFSSRSVSRLSVGCRLASRGPHGHQCAGQPCSRGCCCWPLRFGTRRCPEESCSWAVSWRLGRTVKSACHPCSRGSCCLGVWMLLQEVLPEGAAVWPKGARGLSEEFVLPAGYSGVLSSEDACQLQRLLLL